MSASIHEPPGSSGLTADLLVVGAGAAGLATAIFAARQQPSLRVRCLDGARHIGAKILVSGGSRCNVTNRVVTAEDFSSSAPRTVRNVLRAYPASRAAAFFEEIGVALHEEEDGKLFPETNRSRTVLDALLREAARLGVIIVRVARVVDVARGVEEFVTVTEAGDRWRSRAVVLATGGRSLPKTGSDGGGYQLARRLGHGDVETTPALAPLVVSEGWHARVSGVSQRAALSLRVDGRQRVRLTGSLLWTHFGVSGPVALDLSRHWHRARLEGGRVDVEVHLCPDHTFDSFDEWLREQERARPKTHLANLLTAHLPAAIAEAVLEATGVARDETLAHMTKQTRRQLAHAMVGLPLRVVDSRGYNYAEVTAGGVPLDEVDGSTLESLRCPGLYFAGEILDVDGRLGGFNFQWSWSSAWVVGGAVARTMGR